VYPAWTATEIALLVSRIDAKVAKSVAPKPCGRGWTGTKPPGCTRAKKGEGKAKKARAEKTTKSKNVAEVKLASIGDVKTLEQKAVYAKQEADRQKSIGNKANAAAWEKEAQKARKAAISRDMKKLATSQTSLFGATEYASDLPLFAKHDAKTSSRARFDRGNPPAKAPCGRGWEGTKPPGCKRASSKKSNTKPVQAKPKATKTRTNTPIPGSIAELSPDIISADPKRFQYKILGEHTATGEVGSLSGVKKYDQNLAGIIQVWHDPADGKTYVVNGHNRLALAKKLGADKVAVRYLDVKNPAEARAVGAITNIAEGRGTAIDAAKFFKDTGLSRADLEAKGIPMREKIAQEGLALSQLDDSLFRKTIDGDLPVERAAIIGGGGLSNAKQLDLYNLAEKQAKRGRKITNDVLSELADTVKASEEKSETQFDLFGASEVQQTNAIERATLQAAVKKRLSRDKKLFGTVSQSRAAKDLARAGNQIDIDTSSKISKEAGVALSVFDKLKNVKGGVSDLLNDAATQIKNGGDRKKIEADLYERIRVAVNNDLIGRKDGERGSLTTEQKSRVLDELAFIMRSQSLRPRQASFQQTGGTR